jgi:hypothetical protein
MENPRNPRPNMNGTKDVAKGPNDEKLKRGPYQDWTGLPNIKVLPFTQGGRVVKLLGPVNDRTNKSECHGEVACGKAISTYPRGQGEPICDYFEFEMYERRTLMCLADGCAWGEQSREAARRAAAAYMDYLRENQHSIKDIREAGRLILRSFSKAHVKIIEGYDDIWLAGTTTLCAGILMELDMNQDADTLRKLKELEESLIKAPPFDVNHLDAELRRARQIGAHAIQRKSTENSGADTTSPQAHNSDEMCKWIFVCASIGDCKAFHYSSRTGHFTDITSGNRLNVTDPKDPGGRLGPYVGKGDPDLRNMALYFVPCYEEDVVMLMSDGVHDNLDPQLLGFSPSHINLGNSDSWHDAERDDPSQVDAYKNLFRCYYAKKLLSDVLQQSRMGEVGEAAGVPHLASPRLLTERLEHHAAQLTQTSRDFMEQNQFSRLPDDYLLYPGKMDHAACLSIFAAGLTLSDKGWVQSLGSLPSPTSLMEDLASTPPSTSSSTSTSGSDAQTATHQHAVGSTSHVDTDSSGGHTALTNGSPGPSTSTSSSSPKLGSRRLRCYGMDRTLLVEITVEPTDLITHVIAKVKNGIEPMIGGRAFRLRKGEDDWKRKPDPILKKQFEMKALDLFPSASDVIVVQFGTPLGHAPGSTLGKPT